MRLLSDIAYWLHYVWRCTLATILRLINKLLDLTPFP